MKGNENRRVVIIRHGERVDHRFQDEWVEKCFDGDGKYTRQNLNQPMKLPMRKGYPQSFIRDSPLTAIGCLQATLRGQGIGSANILRNDFEVIVSPSLRCVKTASNVLKGMKNNSCLKIEPCLFEWTQIKWYVNGNMPKWMTKEELSHAGFNIDSKYVPFIAHQDMKEGESLENYYERSHNLFLHLLDKAGNKDLLLVAHGFTMDALTRKLLGKHSPTTAQQMVAIAGAVPYCGMVILEQDSITKKWDVLNTPSQLQMTHKSAHAFDPCTVFK